MPKRDYHKSKFVAKRKQQTAIKKEKQSFVKMIIYFIFLIFIFGAIYFFIFSSAFKIKKVVITGTDNAKDIRAIELIINNFTQYNKFLFFSQKNIFILNKNALKNAIKLNFDFKLIDLKIKTPHTLLVNVKTKAPRIIWREDNKFFTIYSDGRVKNQTDGNIFELPVVNRGTSTSLAIGDLMLSQKQIKYINKLFSLFNFYFKDIQAKQFIVTSLESRQVKLITSEGWYILFNLDLDPADSLTMVKAVLEQKIKDRHNLHYINAKIKDRIYYK